MIKVNTNNTYNILNIKANEFRLLKYILGDETNKYTIKLFENNTYGILGLSNTECNDLRAAVSDAAQPTRGYSDSDNILLKGLCDCVSVDYHEQLNWDDIDDLN